MKKAIMVQVIIFVVAWFVMTPDVAQDNTHLFGLIGGVEIIRGNAIWVLLGAAVLSMLNIWVWWPKTQVTTHSESSPAESTKSAEIKVVEEKDPVVPKMD